jgi:hypothetical protein
MRRHAIGRFVVLAVAVPVAARVLRKAGQSMQARQGESRTSDVLQKAASGLDAITGRRHH